MATFSQAPWGARIQNVLHFLFLALGCIGCIVGWGSVLGTGKLASADSSLDFYVQKVYISAESQSYAYSDDLVKQTFDFADKCNASGKAFIAFLVFAFLTVVIALVLVILRIFSITNSFTKNTPHEKIITMEIYLSAVAAFSYFLAIIVFGGACIRSVQYSSDISNGKPTGLVYCIFCFFFLCFNVFLGFLIRRDRYSWLGVPHEGSEYPNPNTEEYMNYPPSTLPYHQHQQGYGSYQDNDVTSNHEV